VTNDLTQFTLAIDRGNEQVQYLYDEMHPAIQNAIIRVIRTCKEMRVESSICGQAGSNKEMVKFLVNNEIDSISVNADAAYEISAYVAELEQMQQKPTQQSNLQHKQNNLQHNNKQNQNNYGKSNQNHQLNKHKFQQKQADKKEQIPKQNPKDIIKEIEEKVELEIEKQIDKSENPIEIEKREYEKDEKERQKSNEKRIIEPKTPAYIASNIDLEKQENALHALFGEFDKPEQFEIYNGNELSDYYQFENNMQQDQIESKADEIKKKEDLQSEEVEEVLDIF